MISLCNLIRQITRAHLSHVCRHNVIHRPRASLRYTLHIHDHSRSCFGKDARLTCQTTQSDVRRRLEILFKAPGGHSRHPRQNLCPTAVVPWCRLRDRGSRQFIQHDAVLGRSDLLLATLVNTRERSLGKRRHLGPHIAQNTNRQDRTASRYRPLRPHSPGLHGRSDSYIQQHRNIADVASHARCDTAFSHYCP